MWYGDEALTEESFDPTPIHAPTLSPVGSWTLNRSSRCKPTHGPISDPTSEVGLQVGLKIGT